MLLCIFNKAQSYNLHRYSHVIQLKYPSGNGCLCITMLQRGSAFSTQRDSVEKRFITESYSLKKFDHLRWSRSPQREHQNTQRKRDSHFTTVVPEFWQKMSRTWNRTAPVFGVTFVRPTKLVTNICGRTANLRERGTQNWGTVLNTECPEHAAIPSPIFPLRHRDPVLRCARIAPSFPSSYHKNTPSQSSCVLSTRDSERNGVT